MIKKSTSQGNESYHKKSTEEDLPQPPRHSIRTPPKENFNKTPEVKPGTQTDFIDNNIYVKNDVFEVFYEDYLEYKGYVNDLVNTLIPKDDILHQIERENNTEHSKNQIIRKRNRRYEKKRKSGSQINIIIKT